MTMASMGFIAPLPLKFSSFLDLIFCSGPPQPFWSEVFRSLPKIRGGLLPWDESYDLSERYEKSEILVREKHKKELLDQHIQSGILQKQRWNVKSTTEPS